MTTADEARVKASIDNWKRKLLDVSKRNRALNFKPTKVTTVAIVDEQPAEVFRQLYLQDGKMSFLPSESAKADAIETTTKEAIPSSFDSIPDEDDAQNPTFSFALYDDASLSDNHIDNHLQTSLLPEKLDLSLRRIDEQARSSLEEQGVNTLFLALGVLHYRDSDDSDETYRAPLIMLPVQLSRKSARAGYILEASDDEPLVNPALSEYLGRFGVQLPELPDLSSLPEDYDLKTFFVQAIDAVKNRKGWEVKRDIFLSFFSFQKFLMYKDLEAKADKFAIHPVIQQIVLRSGSSTRSLPEDVRTAELDRVFPPENTAQVVNADASQLRAILAVSRGHPIVIEGPPGTGKSQTITNLIAQALRDDKSVLFVAEKMAALSVVHSRLIEAGLGEFCLEMHSAGANKRSVMGKIAEALDASLQLPKAPDSSAPRIGDLRSELTAYSDAVHTPFSDLGLTPYQAYGEFEQVRAAPKLKFTRPIRGVNRAQLDGVERDLQDLAKAVGPIGNPSQHPWRDSTRTFFSEQDLDLLGEELNKALGRFARIGELSARVHADFSLPPINTFTDVQTVSVVAEVIARSPGAPLAVLQSEAWNSPPPRANELVQQGRMLAEANEFVRQRFNGEVLEQEHKDDITFVEAKRNSPLRFLNFLDGRFRAISKRWRKYRATTYKATLLEQAADLRKADVLRQGRSNLTALHSEAQQLFGVLWQGESSDWDALENYIRWVTEFRRVCIDQNLKEQALAAATRPAPDVSAITLLTREVEHVQGELIPLRQGIGWPENHLATASFTEIIERLEALRQNLSLAQRWAAFENARAKVANGLAAEILEAALAGQADFSDLPGAFRRAYFQQWLNQAVQERQPLRAFNTLIHEERVGEFKHLDQALLSENRVGLLRSLRHRAQDKLRKSDVVDAMPFLRRQMILQRGLSPLRATFKRSLPAIRAIKPVFMMSPLSVAQLLDGSNTPFDLVIFDEASQLPTEDAVGAIIRGKQLVVVGDPKQLPPTNFFAVSAGTVNVPLDEDGMPLFEDSQSILEEFMGSGAPMARLKWHYRSSHESLIHFSNVSFYDADLYTFPSADVDSHASGLRFEYVHNGLYEGKGLNMTEARRVADAVVEHAKLHPELSLGVGTFNQRQQIAIQDELEQRRRQNPTLEAFFSRTKSEPFFVKNLENIQGDERDVIFLSVTYGKNADGVLRYNFGPLNGENGWRRLNVITSRARKSMRVFSSMRGDDINPVQTTSQGPSLLRNFLNYAEHGRMDRTITAAAANTESPFEREVYMELSRRGLDLQPQVGVAGYRVDLGVRDPDLPGRYLCGLECDGASYHSSETARDRDRLRQQVLEARGWTIHHVWSTDWFKDKAGQVERLLGLIESTRQSAQAEQAAEEEARAELATLEQAEKQGATPPEPEGHDVEVAQAVPYVFAQTPVLYRNQDFNEAPSSLIEKAIENVLDVEAPLHVADLASRVVAFWGYDRAGSRMMQRVRRAASELARAKKLLVRGDFVFRKNLLETPVRSRAGTGIPAERIAPEEYREAIVMILKSGNGLDRKTLTNKVRTLLGYSRTGSALEAAIGGAIDALLEEGTIGEGSTGIKRRNH